jgi:hypothetical protein
MKKQVAQIAGEPLLDGVFLAASGSYQKRRKQTWPGLFGLAGYFAAEAVDKKTTVVTPAPDVNRRDQACGAYLARTASHLLLVRAEQGFARHHIREQLARLEPGDLARFEFGRLAIAFGTLEMVSVNGERWCYEFSKKDRKKLISMAEANSVAITGA